jgi:glycine dehydrogenase
VREAYQRRLPGRLVGVSKDAHGDDALRLALQTREQHIRRDAATSNLCTAQVLPAIVNSFYAVYHGPDGLAEIAQRVHHSAELLRQGLSELGYTPAAGPIFDTVVVERAPQAQIRSAAEARGMNLRYFSDGAVGIALDERTDLNELAELIGIFKEAAHSTPSTAESTGARESEIDPVGFVSERSLAVESSILPELSRSSEFMTEAVFSRYHTETELERYLKDLEGKDLSLVHSMIPLGSCTMKLNAAAEMDTLSDAGFADIHPWAPPEQTRGYAQLTEELAAWLCDITGFDAVSFQPNSGAQGEYAGLLTIRSYHRARGDAHRRVCLVPESAHGTNPASAVMAGMQVIVVDSDEDGNIDVEDLRAKAETHSESLAASMVTYPSTHGVFEQTIRDVCSVVHHHGGLVYLDGANMNALVGYVRPAELGADVCHLNLHKTFAIPHGGGGPGMGPIAVSSALSAHLPSDPVPRGGVGNSGVGDGRGDANGIAPGATGAVSAHHYGSAGILTISYAYILLMGRTGLANATAHALLNANYLAVALSADYDILYTAPNGRVAHECILDVRHFKKSAGVTVEDIAKRLADYGFHAPTMSWPVSGTLMIEPTESETLAELDRFVDAMKAIRGEIREIEEGRVDVEESALRHAPHTVRELTADTWSHPYSREAAAYPRGWIRKRKFWPAVGRVDNVYGDRNPVCSCAPIQDYADATRGV